MESKALFISICIFLLLPVSRAFAGPEAELRLPGITSAMLKAEYWIARSPLPDQVMMTPQMILQFNAAIEEALPQVMVNLGVLPSETDGNRLRKMIMADKLPRDSERYAKGVRVTSAFYDKLAINLNVPAIQAGNPVEWGFTVRRTDLRTFPTSSPSSEDDESDEFDLFQETALNIAEPLAILHRSLDRLWLYVQTYNYRGWVRAEDVGVAPTRIEWLAKRNAASFVMVTGGKVVPRDAVMGNPVADWRAGMGTRLPLTGRAGGGYQVEIPQRNADGTLAWRKAWIHGQADVSIGYIPYTRAAVIRQAFKMLGEKYSWGGLQDGHDCSSFVMDILAVFGIKAPRNADQQERAPGRKVMLQNAANAAGRYALLARQAEPGATLHMRNHVLLYLGQSNGKHYAIHDLGSYGNPLSMGVDGSLSRVEVMQVVVSELDLPLRSGRKFVEALTSANVWRN